jgi:cytidyltransferase-like protein
MFDRIFIHCLVILAMCASVAQAKPLTMEDLKNAKRIGLMPGTYDPVTDGHIGAAKAAIAQSDLDMLILIPQENPHKFPIPREER